MRFLSVNEIFIGQLQHPLIFCILWSLIKPIKPTPQSLKAIKISSIIIIQPFILIKNYFQTKNGVLKSPLVSLIVQPSLLKLDECPNSIITH